MAKSTSSSVSSIESAVKSNNLLFFAYVSVALLVVVLTVLLWRSGNRVQEAVRVDADARIEEARNDAAAARRDTAQLAVNLAEEQTLTAEVDPINWTADQRR